ncbi:MAG TPA: hypothetical protein VIV60_28965, partial [Polyangiaceae bacterium]
MMRNPIPFNSVSMFITLSSAAVAYVCGCSDNIVVGDEELRDAGAELGKGDGAVNDGGSSVAGNGADPGSEANRGIPLTPIVPFAIGCNDSHELTPIVTPTISWKDAIADANACDLAADATSGVVMACASSNPTTVGVAALPAGQNKEMFVQKRAPNGGGLLFNTPVAGLSPLDIAPSGSGDTFVLGAMNPATDQDPALGLVKITSTGSIAWNKKFYKLYDTTLAYGALAVANDGTVWVTGSTNFVAAQFDDSGNELRRIPMASGGNPGWGAAQAIRILSNGDLLVAGTIDSPIDFGGGALGSPSDALSSGFLARFTATGQYVKSQVFNQNSGVAAVGLAVGADGSIVLTGNLNGTKSIFGCSYTSPMARGFVAKFDDALSVQWTTLVPAGVGGPQIDAQGNIILSTK